MNSVQRFIYGPVKSWRSGTSLGIDPIGDVSTCSFNCAYCQLGQIQKRTAEIKTYVPTKKILDDFKRALDADEFKLEELDVITFAGSGEPTLAKNLAEIIHGLREIMSQKGIQVPISILTNATLFNDDEVCARALTADMISLKLDAPNDEVLSSINQPVEGVTVESILSGIRKLKDWIATSQTMSAPRNDKPELQIQIMIMPKFIKPSLRGRDAVYDVAIQSQQMDCFADARNDREADARNDIADDFVTQLALLVKDLGIKKIQINTPTRPKPVSKTGEYWIETRGNHYASSASVDCFANARNDGESGACSDIEFKELPVITREQAYEIEKKFRAVINDPELEVINVYK